MDDEPLIRKNTADMVAEEGFKIIEARNADVSMTMLERYPSLKLLSRHSNVRASDGLDLARHV